VQRARIIAAPQAAPPCALAEAQRVDIERGSHALAGKRSEHRTPLRKKPLQVGAPCALHGELAALEAGTASEQRGHRRKYRHGRSLEPRESRIGFAVFLVALVIAGGIDYGADEGSLETMLSQTFVVLAWVALWGPAYRLMTAASFRLGRRSFAELADAEIEIRWA